MTIWTPSHRFDPAGATLADRHYNRRKVGSPQFVPPGRCFVMVTACKRAVWVTSWPFAQYVRHAWAGAWVNSIFRNEGAGLSSELIRKAIAHTRSVWPDVPELGIISFVDAAKVKGEARPGLLLPESWIRASRTYQGRPCRLADASRRNARCRTDAAHGGRMTPRTDAVCITPIMGEECTPHKWEQLQKLCRELEVSLSEGNAARQRLANDVLRMAAIEHKATAYAEACKSACEEALQWMEALATHWGRANETETERELLNKAYAALNRVRGENEIGQHDDPLGPLTTEELGEPDKLPQRGHAVGTKQPTLDEFDKGPWTAGEVGAYVESADFGHDVRLNISGDFENHDARYAYACALAATLNRRHSQGQSEADHG